MRRVLIATIVTSLMLTGMPTALGILGGHVTVGDHTTYATITFNHVNRSEPLDPYAAVAVLVKGKPHVGTAHDVLWYDDSFLHRQSFPNGGNPLCEGSVWIVQEGSGLDPQTPVETYTFTDPNGVYWEVTKYTQGPAFLDTADRLTNRAGQGGAYGPAYGVNVLTTPHSTGPGCQITQDVTRYDPALDATGNPQDANGDGEWDVGTTQTTTITYNAVLFLKVDDLGSNQGNVEHGNKDANGNYSASTNDNDDTRDGNSHPYNPNEQADHGENHDHNTYRVDVYWDGRTVTTASTITPINGGGFHEH